MYQSKPTELKTVEPPSAGWLVICLVVAFGAAATAVVPQAVPVLRFIARRFPEGAPYAGWLVSIPSAICALGALLAGIVVDRIGDRRMLLCGAVIVAIGDFGVAISTTFAQILAWRLAEGIGYLALTVGGATMIMRMTDGARRKAAMAFWSAHTPIGFALALTLITPFAGSGDHWHRAFTGHGVAVLVLMVIGFFALNVKLVANYQRGAGTSLVLRTWPVYRLGIASLLSALMQTGFMTALPIGLEARFGMGHGAAISVAVGCLVLNMIAALGLARALRLGLPVQAVMIGGAGFVIAGWTMYFTSETLLVAVIGGAIFCFSLGGLNARVWGMLPNVTPDPSASGATSGLVTQATYLGVLIGPPIVFAGIQDARLLLALLVGPGAMLLMLWAMSEGRGDQRALSRRATGP